jgi:hypothetical protein
MFLKTFASSAVDLDTCSLTVNARLQEAHASVELPFYLVLLITELLTHYMSKLARRLTLSIKPNVLLVEVVEMVVEEVEVIKAVDATEAEEEAEAEEAVKELEEAAMPNQQRLRTLC